MSGITGRTSNKLFQVKTIDLNQPYQVGKRGVTAIDALEDGNFRITYIIDGIKYPSSFAFKIASQLFSDFILAIILLKDSFNCSKLYDGELTKGPSTLLLKSSSYKSILVCQSNTVNNW